MITLQEFIVILYLRIISNRILRIAHHRIGQSDSIFIPVFYRRRKRNRVVRFVFYDKIRCFYFHPVCIKNIFKNNIFKLKSVVSNYYFPC